MIQVMRTIPLLVLLLVVGASSAAEPALSEASRVELELNLRWMLQRERDAEKKVPARVGVWADAGVWHIGAKSIVSALEGDGVMCRVLDKSCLTVGGLKGLEVVVLPGGWAPDQWGAAGESGLAALKAFVEGGGRCVGICAGAYLLSKTVKYDGKEYPYPLGLFDGTATGPVKGLAAYPERGSTKLVLTEAGIKHGLTSLEKAELYYSGGPCFVNGTGVTVLAKYADGSAAVIKRSVGKGEVVLIGGHVERPAPPKKDDDAPPAHAGPLLNALVFPK